MPIDVLTSGRATLGVPLSRLFVPDIRNEVIARGIVADVSGSTIWRWDRSKATEAQAQPSAQNSFR